MDNVLDFPGPAELPPKEENPRPAIYIKPANFEQEIDEMERHLVAAKRHTYQRNGDVVQVGAIKVKDPDGSEPAYVVPVKVRESTLIEFSTSATSWLQKNKDGFWKEVRAPLSHVKALLQRGPRLNLPVLSEIITAPLLLPDGSCIERRGYDEKSGLLFSETSEVFPPIPRNPTDRQMRDAFNLLTVGLLGEFMFRDELSGSVALSGLLTASVRPGMYCAPLYAVTAPEMGSGKSYLQTLWSLLGLGQVPSFVNVTKTGDRGDEELNKHLSTKLQKGVPSIAIGNCPRGYRLGGAVLCELLTSPRVSSRIYGKTEEVDCSTHIFVSASGNNLGLSDDMARRTVMCRLDAQVENTGGLEFVNKPDLLLKNERPKYFVAALTLLCGFMAAGKPAQSIKPLNGFEEWSDLVRSCIVWLGLPDPVETQKELRAIDPARETLSAVLAAVNELFGGKEFTAGHLAGVAAEATLSHSMRDKNPNATAFAPSSYEDRAHPETFELLRTIAPDRDSRKINAMAAGKWLGANVGRWADGMRLVRREYHSQSLWHIEIAKAEHGDL